MLTFECVCVYLQVFGGLLIAGHEHELGTNAAEVHVTQKGGTLHCGIVRGLWKKRISCSITVHSGKEKYYKYRIIKRLCRIVLTSTTSSCVELL